MSGYFFVHRKVFDHPIFKDEPFTEREAWLWLINEAAWHDTRVRVGRATFNIRRGELVHAVRYFVEAWKWKSTSRVVRFLKRLENDAMIRTLAEREATRITICNYDKYQAQQNADRTPTDTLAERPQNREEESKNLDVHEDRGATPRSQAMEVATQLGKLCGYQSPPDWPLGWHGAPLRIEGWIRKGWRVPVIIASCTEQIARKRDGPPRGVKYFEPGIATAHAELAAPLPTATIIPQETIEVRRATKTNTPTDGIRSLREKLTGAGASGIRPEPDGADVRLLPKG